MTKKLNIIILFIITIMIFPWNTFAKEISVSFDSIELVEKSDNVIVLEEPTIVNNNMNINLIFEEMGDSITYKLIIKNNDSEDYYLNLKDDDKYLTYELDNKKIKSKSTSTIKLAIKYTEKVPDDLIGKK